MTISNFDIAVDVDFYKEHGWVIVPDVFTRLEVERIAQTATAIGDLELANHTGLPIEPVTVDVDDSGGMQRPRKVDWAYLKHQSFRRFVLDPRLGLLVSALLGGVGYLVRDQVFLKPAEIGSEKPWHQDQPHLELTPADSVIAAWIALDDAGEDNGCLRYIDGSHKGPVLDHHPMKGAEHNALVDDEQRRHVRWDHEVPAVVPAGGVAFHHPLMLHSSAPNISSRPRRAYSTHWATDTVQSLPGGQSLERAYSYRIGARRHAVYCP